jgi:multicomponent Na+:H+ antiporter subunit G
MLGLFRFPDLFTKLHAGSLLESFALPLCIIGTSLMQKTLCAALKNILVVVILLILNPIIANILSKSARK